MEAFAASTKHDSSSKELEDIDGGSPSSTPLSDDYMYMMDKKSVEQEDKKEADSISGSTSPTDSTVTSKTAAAAQAPAKVRMELYYVGDM